MSSEQPGLNNFIMRWECFFSCFYRNKKELMESIKMYKPTVSSVSQVRVLLIGPVGAGKSSFFNSINSVFRGHVTSQAIAGSSTTSLTTQVISCLLMVYICGDWFQNENPVRVLLHFVLCLFSTVSHLLSESWARGETSANHLVWYHGTGGKQSSGAWDRWHQQHP